MRHLRIGLIALAIGLALGPLGWVSPAAAEPGPEGHPFGWIFGRGRLGIRVQPMTPELREHLGAPGDQGVLVVKVAPERPAARAGVQVGDVVVAVDGDPIHSPHGLARRIRSAAKGATLTLHVVRDGESQVVEVEPDDREDIRGPEIWGPEAEEWVEEFGHQLERGGRHLERRLRQLEKRFDELQRRLEEGLEALDEEPQQKT